MKRLWDPTDQYSMLNIDRYNASVRYGVSYWLWGDADVVETLTTRYGLTMCASRCRSIQRGYSF